jgi:hypothetical protein
MTQPRGTVQLPGVTQIVMESQLFNCFAVDKVANPSKAAHWHTIGWTLRRMREDRLESGGH